MVSLILKLNPERLADPNLDIRYVLPGLLAERTGGLVQDDGYDYAGEHPDMYLFLTTTDAERALPLVLEVLRTEIVLGNFLAPVIEIGIRENGVFRPVHPPGSTFSLPAEIEN